MLTDDHPPMLSALEATHFAPIHQDGGFPAGFLDFIYEKMKVSDPEQVLHLCSGTIKRGITVDIRPETGAQHICDARHTPFADASFRWVLCDPPPVDLIHMGIYGLTPATFPKPEELLNEASRLLVPGGVVCILSNVEPASQVDLREVGTFALLMGSGYMVRCAFIYERLALD